MFLNTSKLTGNKVTHILMDEISSTKISNPTSLKIANFLAEEEK